MSTRPTLVIFPGWQDNPYPTTMALAAMAAGVDAVFPRRLDDVVRRLHAGRRGDIFHMQWTAPVCQRARTENDATAGLRRFLGSVNAFRDNGGHTVWTIHNAMPHELRYREHEVQLMRELARVVDRIHVMNPSTAAVLAPEVILPPEKIVVVPHPTFAGVYPDSTSRSAAKASFDLEPQTRVVLFLGQIRAYKGIATLLEALRSLPDDVAGGMALLLAGKVDAEGAEELERALPTNMRVVFEPGYVSDVELARWYRAADVTVLPYERILNSGSAMLAATFGLPVVLPGELHLRDEFGSEGWVHFYDQRNAVGDIASLLSTDALYGAPAESWGEFTRLRAPWRISQRFAREAFAGWLPGTA